MGLVLGAQRPAAVGSAESGVRNRGPGTAAGVQASPPAGATEHAFVEPVSVPISRTEAVPVDAVKAEPTATAALTNTGPPGRRAQADRRTLTFSSGALSPQAGLDERLASGLAEVRAAGRGFVYGFISLNVFLTETIRDELLRFDVTLLGPHDTMHKARLPADAAVLAEIVDLPHVEWSGFSTLEQKTSSDLGVPAPETAGLTGASTSLDIVVNLFDDDARRHSATRWRATRERAHGVRHDGVGGAGGYG
jgi:hypothetical protein